jgi:hypothetical protein
MCVVMKTAHEDAEPVRGDLNYRVCVVPQVPGKTFCVHLDESGAARQLADVLADFQLFLGDNRIMPDYSNCVWIEHWDGSEWEGDEDIRAEREARK